MHALYSGWLHVAALFDGYAERFETSLVTEAVISFGCAPQGSNRIKVEVTTFTVSLEMLIIYLAAKSG